MNPLWQRANFDTAAMQNWNELFCRHLLDEYRQSIGPTGVAEETLITYLLAHNLIPAVTVRRYVILKEFDARYRQNGHHKTKTVLQLAEDLGVSENTVWTALKDHLRDFDQHR